MATFSIESKARLVDVDIANKKVLIRTDYNVPMKDGVITDNTRIVATLPTINHCLEQNCVVILMSHLGRPDGKVVPKFSLKPVSVMLSEILKKPVTFLDDCVGENVEKACAAAKPGDVILLENLRFHAEEEGSGVDENGTKFKPDAAKIQQFREQLSKLGDVYVNDAFGTAHRAHSSIVGIDLKVKVAGMLFSREMEYFQYILEKPKRPFVAIMGGAKVRDKIQIIEKMLDIVDELIIGGGMSYTFLKMQKDMKIGQSLFDEEGSKIIDKLQSKANKKGVKIHLPVDFITADKFGEDAKTGVTTVEEGIPDNLMGLDIGPKTCELFSEIISKANLVLWNGPMGVFEMKPFENGTRAVLDALVKYTKEKDLISVIGGGDSAAATVKFGGASKVSHVSTGGGASMELLEGKILPGLQALSDK